MANRYPVALGHDHFLEAYRKDEKYAPHGDDYIEKSMLNEAHISLNKALSVTGIIPADGTTGGDAQKVQDLLPFVTNTTLSAQNYAPFWNAINKVPTISDVVENTTLDNLGGDPGFGFVDPSTLTGGGNDNNPTLKRHNQQVKFYAKNFSTQLSAALVTGQGMSGAPAPGNIEGINSYTALNTLIIQMNYAAWHGDASKNSLEPNGVLQQIRAAHSISGDTVTRFDCQGQPLTTDVLSEIKAVTIRNGAVGADLWWSPDTLADMEKQMSTKNLYDTGDSKTLINNPDSYLALQLNGEVNKAKMHRDLHLDPAKGYRNAPTTADAGAPTKPTSVTGTSTSSAGALNAFGKDLGAASYYYSVSSVGINGQSDATAVSGAVTSTAAQNITLTITNADASTLKFRVFRGTTSTVSTHQYLGEVNAESVASGSTTTFVDNGEKIPGTSVAAVLYDMALPDGSSIIQARQLLPMTLFELPRYAFNRPNIWIAGFCFQVRAPQHQLVIENIGRYTG